MAQFLTDTAVGAALGFLAGLGTGGGSILILYLTLVRDFSAQTARCINLLFFLPGAIIATFIRRKHLQLDFKLLTLPIIIGCISAALAAYLFRNADTAMLRPLFGILLLIAGLRELRYKKGRED